MNKQIEISSKLLKQLQDLMKLSEGNGKHKGEIFSLNGLIQQCLDNLNKGSESFEIYIMVKRPEKQLEILKFKIDMDLYKD